MVTLSTRSRWMIWAMFILHCVVSSETQFETWWWPSARAETYCLSNKCSTTLLVVYWLYYLYHLIVSNTTGVSQLKPNVINKYWCVRRTLILFFAFFKEERNILHALKRKKANWIGHILRRNCLLKHVIEKKIEERVEVTGRRRRRRKQLQDGLKE
jgi:hypothetical protein